MIYAKSFFDLQLRVAVKICALSGIPLARALIAYTNLYVRFGLGRDFSAAHPVWQAYLSGLQDADDMRAWTYRFYLSRSWVNAGPPVAAVFGCFSYTPLPDAQIRLHFHNLEREGGSSLHINRLAQRLTELRKLFAHVKQTSPGTASVVGMSWLYNLEAYRRLFPPAYGLEAQVADTRFTGMPLWGKFLNRNGQVKDRVANPFLERLEKLTCLADLASCFAFLPRSAKAPVDMFYDFYSVS
jgi:hypothetical protein